MIRQISLLFLIIFNLACLAQETTIFISRHAEKGIGNDPDLTPTGQLRAIALSQLKSHFSVEISAVYTTKYKRTIQTGLPTAKKYELNISSDVSPVDFSGYLQDILANHKTKAVLLIGHSNTVPEFINFLKPSLNLEWIKESDFSNLYKIILKENQEPDVFHYRYEALNGKLVLNLLGRL